MLKNIFTVAILGVGARGGDSYGQTIQKSKDKFKIVSLCDMRQERLDRFGDLFEVAKEERFLEENVFFEKKRADVLIIATQDADHVRHAKKAFELGYDVLLEKPISDNYDECVELLECQKKYGAKALVCHVLRYAPVFVKAAELLDNGEIGRLVAINALERVGFWHQAHSYVRGNWRSSKDSTPMILAKCCHDLDLLQFYAKSKCKSLSSVGDLTFFKKEYAPEGATHKCVDCPHLDSCIYSAKRIYVQRWIDDGRPEDVFPFNTVAMAPNTKENLTAAIEKTPYGRCVFLCDNDVVDHQIVAMTFENGVKAELTMTAFTETGGRRITFFGTHGELVLDEQENELRLKKFHSDTIIFKMEELIEKGYNHGGGDKFLIERLYDVLCGTVIAGTSLAESIESHLMGICAEKSRLNGGDLVLVHKE